VWYTLTHEEAKNMTHDEFIAEYCKVSDRAVYLSKKARCEGLLALEDEIDSEKYNQRDIFEYGLRFTIDGTDNSIIRDILENIIKQEEDKYTHLLMGIKKEAVLSIQAGDNTRIVACKLNSLTDLILTNDPIIQKITNEADDEGKLSEDEIDAIIGGNN
jgi:flagellar motor component MotA